MLKAPVLLASFGLTLNLMLWGVPGMLATSAAAHALLPRTPTLADALQQTGTQKPAITTALVQLVGAESEALQVAAAALQQPAPRDLAPRASAAGAHVETALQDYLNAAQSLLSR
jgi:hypothetical protein